MAAMAKQHLPPGIQSSVSSNIVYFEHLLCARVSVQRVHTIVKKTSAVPTVKDSQSDERGTTHTRIQPSKGQIHQKGTKTKQQERRYWGKGGRFG